MGDEDEWADHTRRVLTRDLLVRAAHAASGEARALEFRALHLNLPLVGEAADRMGLSPEQRRIAEHAGMDGLHEAVRCYDPYSDLDFAEHAAPYVERHLAETVRVPRLDRLPARRGSHLGSRAHQSHPVRLVVRRMALVIAGSRG